MTETNANKLAVGSCVLAVAIIGLGILMPIGPMLLDPDSYVRGRAEGRLLGHIFFAVVGMILGGVALRAARRFRRMDICIKAIIGLTACAAVTAIRVVTLVYG